jgi:ABC-type antimicrobial peptide transport system permease subunit
MTFRDLFKTALTNLRRHQIRTLLNAVGVTIGILTLVTMLSLGVGVQREMTGVFDDTGLETVRVRPASEERNAFTSFSEPRRTVLITPALVAELASRDDVQRVRPLVYPPYNSQTFLAVESPSAGRQMVQTRVGLTPWGPRDPFALPPTVIAGQALDDDLAGQVVASTNVLAKLGYGPEGTGSKSWDSLVGQEVEVIYKAPRGETLELGFRLAGVIEDFPGSNYPGVYVSLPDALRIKAWWYDDPQTLERDGYDGLMVRATSLQDVDALVVELKARGLQVDSYQSALSLINKVMIVVQTMLGAVGGLALLVAALGIANTMLMAVYERTAEIGVLKAIGASPGDVRALFVVEASLISVAGGIVGTIVGWLLSLGLNQGVLAVFRWQKIPMQGTFFVVTPWLGALALAFATLVGLLAGLYPAARAARLDPLEALRHE